MRLIIALAIAIIIYTYQKKIYKNIWDKGLSVSITFLQEGICVGDKGTLREVIVNDKHLPLPALHIKFDVDRSLVFDDSQNAIVSDKYYRNDAFSILGNQRITRELRFLAVKRGVYRVKGIHVIAKDFFLANTFAKSAEAKDYVYVFPRKLSDTGFIMLYDTLLGEIISTRSLIEDLYSFRGIREYDNRSEMRKINWKASAKANSLMINVYDYVMEFNVKILLNLDTNTMLKTEKMQETSIELASTIADGLLRRGIPVSLCDNGMYMEEGKTGSENRSNIDTYGEEIDKRLCRICGTKGNEAFLKLIGDEVRINRRNITYLIISSYRKEDLLQGIDTLAGEGRCVMMVSPYYDIENEAFNRSYIRGYRIKYEE